MKPCPYCSEDIQENAKKCKHCNEWLDGNKIDGSTSARAIAKGIKQKEYADWSLGFSGILSLIISCMLGGIFQNVWVGVVIFIVFMVYFGHKYYKE